MKWKIITLGCLLLFSQVIQAQDSINEIVRVARGGYMEYLLQIPAGSEVHYGFKNREEFSRVSIGNPYRLCTVADDFFSDLASTSGGGFVLLNEYRVPLRIGNENRVLLTVAKMNGMWQVVDLGGSGLAAEIGEAEKKLPRSGDAGMLLRIFRLSSDFVVSGTAGDPDGLSLYPLESARNAIGRENLGADRVSMEKLHALTRDLLKNKPGQQ